MENSIVLQFSLFIIRVISAVSYDDVVGEVYAHSLARFFYTLCYSVVVSAWSWVVAWMVVAQT